MSTSTRTRLVVAVPPDGHATTDQLRGAGGPAAPLPCPANATRATTPARGRQFASLQTPRRDGEGCGAREHDADRPHDVRRSDHPSTTPKGHGRRRVRWRRAGSRRTRVPAARPRRSGLDALHAAPRQPSPRRTGDRGGEHATVTHAVGMDAPTSAPSAMPIVTALTRRPGPGRGRTPSATAGEPSRPR